VVVDCLDAFLSGDTLLSMVSVKSANSASRVSGKLESASSCSTRLDGGGMCFCMYEFLPKVFMPEEGKNWK